MWTIRIACALGWLLAGGSAVAGAAELDGHTYLTVEGPTGPKAGPGTPILQSITAQYDVRLRSGLRMDVQPQFHFLAPHGDAVRLHRELVETDSAITAAGIRDAMVSIPAARQQAGAVIKGGWPCGPGRYHVTLRAWLEDSGGRRGNALQYTIHCHELVMF